MNNLNDLLYDEGPALRRLLRGTGYSPQWSWDSLAVECVSADDAFIEGFWAKVRIGPGCWIWQGTRDHSGYGSFSVRHQKFIGAHRIAYILTKGPIPDGLAIDHLCCTPACTRPDHLQAITMRENSRRRRKAA